MPMLAAGAELHDALAAACARTGVLRGMAHLVGPLESARLSPGPDADALALTGPLYLVAGTALIAPGGITLYGVISWEDQGLPRMVAGRIEAAIGAGVTLALVADESAGADDSDDEVDDEVDDEGEAEEPPARKPARVDLGRELSALAERPARSTGAAPRASSARAPSPVSAPSPTPRAPQVSPAPAAPPRGPAPTDGKAPAGKPGWAAAVAASSRTPAPRAPRPGGAPSPDELGFEEAPALRLGDVLKHPRFGDCMVSQVTGRDRVKVRRPTGASFDLSLTVCRFVREPDDAAGRRVFRLVIEG